MRDEDVRLGFKDAFTMWTSPVSDEVFLRVRTGDQEKEGLALMSGGQLLGAPCILFTSAYCITRSSGRAL